MGAGSWKVGRQPVGQVMRVPLEGLALFHVQDSKPVRAAIEESD